jgi:large subunit ribosomal protein L15
MELHSLKPAKGSVKSKTRIGRGQGSGKGGTSTRGHKGAKSRSGWSKKKNFEGGQMPLQMRLPKVGFKNPNRVEFVVFNVANLQSISEKYSLSEITLENLYANRIIKKRDRVKVLGNGDISKKVNVSVHAISASAKEKIEAQGGTVNLV